MQNVVYVVGLVWMLAGCSAYLENELGSAHDAQAYLAHPEFVVHENCAEYEFVDLQHYVVNPYYMADSEFRYIRGLSLKLKYIAYHDSPDRQGNFLLTVGTNQQAQSGEGFNVDYLFTYDSENSEYPRQTTHDILLKPHLDENAVLGNLEWYEGSRAVMIHQVSHEADIPALLTAYTEIIEDDKGHARYFGLTLNYLEKDQEITPSTLRWNGTSVSRVAIHPVQLPEEDSPWKCTKTFDPQAESEAESEQVGAKGGSGYPHNNVMAPHFAF